LSSTSELASFLGPPRLEPLDLCEPGRFPNLVVAQDGAVVAIWGAERMLSRRSPDGGVTWEPAVEIGPGMQGGGAVVDETTGDLIAHAHDAHPPTDGTEAPRTQYRSRDHARSWRPEAASFAPDAAGYVPSLHFAEHGITLTRGSCAGRLIRPARIYRKPQGVNTAIYSDDHGATWQSSEPFPVEGTGEGAIAERAEGTLYYSSRRHQFQEGEARRWERLHALSRDGGGTWVAPAYHANLPDGPRYRGELKRAACWNGHFGMAAGLARLPVADRDIYIYSNVDQPEHTRHGMCLWASFDGGASWPVKRRIDDGPAAYSSLAAGRPGASSEGGIYLLFERWDERAIRLVRCNLAWILEGEATGDGAVPIEHLA